MAKKILALVIALGLFIGGLAGPSLAETIAPEAEWVKTFGDSMDDRGYSAQQTSDGGYIITGYTQTLGGNDIWLIKTDSEGTKEWDKTFNWSSNDCGESVQQTSDGGYIITGYKGSFSPGDKHVWLIKTDFEGTKEWDKTFGDSSEDLGKSVQQTSDGGYIIAGYTGSFGAGSDDVWLIKTDSEGTKEWDKTFGGSSEDWGESVQQTSDGGYIIAGATQSFGAGSFDVWLIKTDSDGTKEWDKTFGGYDLDRGKSVQQTSDGGYIIAGMTTSYGAGGNDFWLIKTDSDGTKEWDKTFGGSSEDWGESAQQTSSGGYIITGITHSFGDGGGDMWLIKADSDGNKQWDKTFGGSSYDRGYSVQQTSDGGYIITGYTDSFGAGWNDVWLVRVATHFASFDLTDVKIKFAEVGNQDSFELAGRFTLDPDSDGIELTADDVVVKVGEFTAMVPAGSFIQKDEKCKFKGTSGGITEAKIDLGKGAFHIKAEGINLTGVTTNLATIELAIGTDRGSTEVRLIGELSYGVD